MNTYRANKIRNTIYDFLLAGIIVVFIMLATLSPTLGNASYCKKFANKDASITASLQQSLKEKTDAIASTTGIVPEAFDFAIGQKKISSTQKEIVISVYAGNNFDYTDSAAIENGYNNGIKEYYRFNGLELDNDALERAVPMACAAFNEVFSINNNVEMNKFVTFMSKYSIALSVILVIIGALVAIKIFDINHGRTKVLSHYGSSLICAGDATILIALCDLFVHFGNRLYLTSNPCFNAAFAQGARRYFLLIAIFGIVFDVAGFSMLKHVKKYYEHKSSKQLQEDNINRSLYVKRADGEDKTVAEIVEDRRKEFKENGTK